MVAKIQITGLREFQGALRQMDAALPRQIRLTLNQAADIVIDDARPRVPSRSGRARASIKARSTQRAVRVAAGGRRAPYYPWLDFGGRVGPGRSIVRPFYTDGRYLYDAYYRRKTELVDVAKVGLADLARRAGLEVD